MKKNLHPLEWLEGWLLAVIKILFLILGAIFVFRWELFYTDMPIDALYRAIVLQIFRILIVLAPFGVYLFKYPDRYLSRGTLVVLMWAAFLYMIYYAIFLPAGFHFSVERAFGVSYMKLVQLARGTMFFIWLLYFSLASLALIRLRVAHSTG